jgi:hypothetical protein
MRFIQATAALMIVASMIVASAGSSLAQQTHKYRAALSRLPLDNVLQRTVTGKGAVTAELAGQRLAITGTFEGLTKAATIANVHMSPVTGVAGPVLFPLILTEGVAGTVSGSAELTPPQVEALASNKLYVQIHSETAPDGNLWGWLFIEEKR